jgi:hypothetical protein
MDTKNQRLQAASIKKTRELVSILVSEVYEKCTNLQAGSITMSACTYVKLNVVIVT